VLSILKKKAMFVAEIDFLVKKNVFSLPWLYF